MAYGIPHREDAMIHRVIRCDDEKEPLFVALAPVMALCFFLISGFATVLSFFME